MKRGLVLREKKRIVILSVFHTSRDPKQIKFRD